MGSQDSNEGSHPWSNPHELNQTNDSFALVPFQTQGHTSEYLPLVPISSSMEQPSLQIEVYDSGNPQISHQLNPSHDPSSLAFFPTQGTRENLSFLPTKVYDHSLQGNILHNPEIFHPQENLIEEFGLNNSPQQTPIEGIPKRWRGENPMEMEGTSRTEEHPLFPPVLARDGSPVPEEPKRKVALLAPGLSCCANSTRPPTRPPTRRPRTPLKKSLKQATSEIRKFFASSSREKKKGNFSDFLLGASRLANSSSPFNWDLGTKMTTTTTQANQSNPETSSKGKAGISYSLEEFPDRDAGEQRNRFMTEENATIQQVEEFEEREMLAHAIQLSLEPFEPASQVPYHGTNAPYLADHFQTQNPVTSLPLVPFQNALYLADHSQIRNPITPLLESSNIPMPHGTYYFQGNGNNEFAPSNQNTNQNPNSSLREGGNSMFPGNSSIDHERTNSNLGTSGTFDWNLPTEIDLLLNSINVEECLKELDEPESSGQKMATEAEDVPNSEPQKEDSEFLDWVELQFNEEDDPKKF